MVNSYERKFNRQSVLKTAKVVADHGVFDCIVMDFSSKGARVLFGATTSLPEHVTIKLSDGTSYDAVCRWVRGEEAGFEFTADTSMSLASRHLAWQAYERLLAEEYGPLAQLERADFLDDESVRVAAVAVFAALVDLQTVLKRCAVRPDPDPPEPDQPEPDQPEPDQPEHDQHSAASTAASTGVLSGTGPLQSIAAGNSNTATTIMPRPFSLPPSPP